MPILLLLAMWASLPYRIDTTILLLLCRETSCYGKYITIHHSIKTRFPGLFLSDFTIILTFVGESFQSLTKFAFTRQLGQSFIPTLFWKELLLLACPLLAAPCLKWELFLQTCVWNPDFLRLNQTFLWIFWQFAWRLTVKNFPNKVWFRPKKPGFQTRVRKNSPISARVQPKKPASSSNSFQTRVEIHNWPTWRIKINMITSWKKKKQKRQQ